MQALSVLVVEDDALIGVLLADMLEAMGHEVCAIEATETDTVIAAARWRPDLMIVDARLGDGSGVAAVEQILLAGHLPHLFVTGDALRVLMLRPDAIVIQKPYREADLASAIRHAMEALPGC